MNHLLDTHILLWWYTNRSQISARYESLLLQIKEKGESIALSIISFWEIAKLVSKKKFEVSFSLDHWFEDLKRESGLVILPLSNHIILDSTRLGPQFPKDPADQLIAATARCHNLRLITADSRIIESGVVAIA